MLIKLNHYSPVSGVIEDNDQDTRWVVLGQGEDGGQGLSRWRRREDRAGDGSVEHAVADVTGERGLVAGAAAAKNGHAAGQNIDKVWNW